MAKTRCRPLPRRWPQRKWRRQQRQQRRRRRRAAVRACSVPAEEFMTRRKGPKDPLWRVYDQWPARPGQKVEAPKEGGAKRRRRQKTRRNTGRRQNKEAPKKEAPKQGGAKTRRRQNKEAPKEGPACLCARLCKSPQGSLAPAHTVPPPPSPIWPPCRRLLQERIWRSCQRGRVAVGPAMHSHSSVAGMAAATPRPAGHAVLWGCVLADLQAQYRDI